MYGLQLQLPAIVEARYSGLGSAQQSGDVRTFSVEMVDNPDDPFGAQVCKAPSAKVKGRFLLLYLDSRASNKSLYR